MEKCNSDLARYVRNTYYDRLNVLPPTERFVESFRLALAQLEIAPDDSDELLGSFLFRKPLPPTDRPYTDAADANVLRTQVPAAFGCTMTVDKAHLCADYGTILRSGLAGYDRRIDAARATHPESVTLRAMKSTIAVVRAFSARLEAVAAEKEASAPADRRETWRQIRRAVAAVPYEPARTLREALQSIWIIHFLIPLAENAWYSISLGRLDAYLLPYYESFLRDGGTPDEAKRLFRSFYRLLNDYADGACALNVGGESYNALSRLLIECQSEFALPAPILAARITDRTPDDVWDALIDERLFAMGQPTFYGEASCVRALEEKGLPSAAARRFSVNSCMGIGIAGQEFNSMWGCVFMTPAALECALNGGQLLQSGERLAECPPPCDLDSLLTNFETCVRALLDRCAVHYEALAAHSEACDPDVFTSILTSDCIERGCDRISGAQYHNVTVECMGMVNCADGIYAINEWVFRRKKYTLPEVLRAVAANFDGFDTLRRDLASGSKYGQNGAADAVAVRVADIMQRSIRRLDHGNVYYLPSLHTLDANVRYGASWHAAFDGRRGGQPFAKNAGPVNEARPAGATSLVLSAAKLPQYQFYGGQPLDINFTPDNVRRCKPAIRTLISVYLQRGGLQFQVNALSPALLRDAMAHPERHAGLVVRVGGFSIYFSALSPQSQLEFVQRVEADGG